MTLGAVASGSRRRPDGVVLAWRYTDPTVVVADGLVPFFIDWGSSPHPALTAAKGATLTQLRAEHPDAPRVQKMIDALGLDLRVSPGISAGDHRDNRQPTRTRGVAVKVAEYPTVADRSNDVAAPRHAHASVKRHRRSHQPMRRAVR